MMTFFHTLIERFGTIGRASGTSAQPLAARKIVERSIRRDPRPPNRERFSASNLSGTLAGRRMSFRLRRLIAAVCAGLAMFAALQCVAMTVRTQPAVIATRAISRGNVIEADSLVVRNIARDPSLADTFRSLDDAIGKFARVDIAENSLILRSMARASPAVPQGHTIITVHLASSADELMVGDMVMLAGATLDGAAYDESQESDTPILRELATEAVLLEAASKDSSGASTAVFAMRPEDAAAVLRAQQYSAIIAVTG